MKVSRHPVTLGLLLGLIISSQITAYWFFISTCHPDVSTVELKLATKEVLESTHPVDEISTPFADCYTCARTATIRRDDPIRSSIMSFSKKLSKHASDAIEEMLSIMPADRAWTYWDVGANIGSTSLGLARRCPNCLVYAFEAIPLYAAWIRERASQEDMQCVKTFPTALCNYTGIATIFADDPNSNMGWNTLLRGKSQRGQARIDICCQTIDAFWGDGLARPDFIKIDVEGSEPSVIKGAMTAFAAWRNDSSLPALLIEIGWGTDVADRPDARELNEALEALFELGYLRPDGLHSIHKTTDVLLITSGHVEELRARGHRDPKSEIKSLAKLGQKKR